MTWACNLLLLLLLTAHRLLLAAYPLLLTTYYLLLTTDRVVHEIDTFAVCEMGRRELRNALEKGVAVRTEPVVGLESQQPWSSVSKSGQE